MPCLKPRPDAALDCCPILHKLVRADSILADYFPQGIAQIVAQERDAMSSGIGLCVSVSVRRHNRLSSEVPVHKQIFAALRRSLLLFLGAVGFINVEYLDAR